MLRQIGEFAVSTRPAFVMAVDPQEILVTTTHEGVAEWERAIKLSTPSILRNYADSGSLDHVEGFYLESLVEAWLRDLAQGWKSAQPPGYEELEKIGLAARLRGSELHTEASL